MKALNTRQAWAAMISLSLSWDANSIAVAQYVKDPPWNPDHIDHSPLRSAAPSWPRAENRQALGIISLLIPKTRDRLICTSRSSIASKVQLFATLPVACTKCMR
jgi:hypothetical protein